MRRWRDLWLLVVLGTALLAVPASGAPTTTLQRTIVDREQDQLEHRDHNLLDYGPGEDYVVLGAEDERFRPPRRGSIINFLQLTDFQIVDEESPGRVEFLDRTQRPPLNPFAAAYRPQESLTTQITEAMVRQARNTRSPVTSEELDLTILTGDNADSQQYNETRWFIDILDGTTGSSARIDPDSGTDAPCPPGQVPFDNGSPYDGVRGGGDLGYYEPDSSDGEDGAGYSPRQNENRAEVDQDVRVRDFPGLFERAQDPFEALGLGMPWYSAFGNHDALVQGNSPDAFVGPGGPAFPPNQEKLNESYDTIVRGCLKPSQLPTGVTPDQFIANPAAFASQLNSAVVPRDDRRCHLPKDSPVTDARAPCQAGWIPEHFNTTGTPEGHGFAERPPIAVANHDGYYSFSPRPGLRFVVLDTVTDECGTLFCSEGSVDDPQFKWLDEELDTSESVVVFAHHTLDTTNMPSTDSSEGTIHFGERDSSPPGVESLEELFCRHPNVLAQVNGHSHANRVQEHDCTANSFWEVTTAAHIDWPQQSRMIELVRNNDATISLVLTIIDHGGPANPGGPPSESGGRGAAGESVDRLASIGREIAYNDWQHGRGARGNREDRNVIIKTDKPWTFGSD